jgi:hypothetical protein
MELDELRSTWNKIETPVKTAEELQLMLAENRHPVLKVIRKQIIIEIVGWSAFVLCYYTMFDGDRKPLFINAILVGTVLAAMVHNLMGYSFARYLVNGDTIKTSLKNYFSKVKVYAVLSVGFRLLFITGLLMFFSYNIHFNTRKYVLLAVGLGILGFQLVLLGRIWIKRLKNLKKTLTTLS